MFVSADSGSSSCSNSSCSVSSCGGSIPISGSPSFLFLSSTCSGFSEGRWSSKENSSSLAFHHAMSFSSVLLSTCSFYNVRLRHVCLTIYCCRYPPSLHLHPHFLSLPKQVVALILCHGTTSMWFAVVFV